MSVNEKIRLIRETKGFTQEQVAAKLDMSPNAHGDIERGENDPKLSKLEKIAEVFEMPLSDLVDLSEKGTLNITFNNHGKQRDVCCIGSSAAEKEIALKDKELAMQQREIEYLKEHIALLKKE